MAKEIKTDLDTEFNSQTISEAKEVLKAEKIRNQTIIFEKNTSLIECFEDLLINKPTNDQ